MHSDPSALLGIGKKRQAEESQMKQHPIPVQEASLMVREGTPPKVMMRSLPTKMEKVHVSTDQSTTEETRRLQGGSWIAGAHQS